LLYSLKNRETGFDWESFWADYRRWSIRVPFTEARDSIPLYSKLMEVVVSGDLPISIALEAKFNDLAMREKKEQAADLIPLIDEYVELRAADEFFLRHLFIVGMLGGKKDYLRNIFLKVYMPNAFFDRAEKYLMRSVADVPNKVKKAALQDRDVREN
jgi:hypothetical protein